MRRGLPGGLRRPSRRSGVIVAPRALRPPSATKAEGGVSNHGRLRRTHSRAERRPHVRLGDDRQRRRLGPFLRHGEIAAARRRRDRRHCRRRRRGGGGDRRGERGPRLRQAEARLLRSAREPAHGHRHGVRRQPERVHRGDPSGAGRLSVRRGPCRGAHCGGGEARAHRRRGDRRPARIRQLGALSRARARSMPATSRRRSPTSSRTTTRSSSSPGAATSSTPARCAGRSGPPPSTSA